MRQHDYVRNIRTQILTILVSMHVSREWIDGTICCVSDDVEKRVDYVTQPGNQVKHPAKLLHSVKLEYMWLSIEDDMNVKTVKDLWRWWTLVRGEAEAVLIACSQTYSTPELGSSQPHLPKFKARIYAKPWCNATWPSHWPCAVQGLSRRAWWGSFVYCQSALVWVSSL